MNEMNNQPDTHEAARRRAYAKRRRNIKLAAMIAICVVLLAVWTALVVIVVRRADSAATQPPAQTTAEQTTAAATETTPATEAAEAEFEVKEISNTAVHKGSLILVSGLLNMPYDFDANADAKFMNIWENKTKSYRVAYSDRTIRGDVLDMMNEMFDAYKAECGRGDYQITHTVRTLEEQTEIFDEYVEDYGSIMGPQLAARPGFSEHHSGYAFDMNVYTDNGESFSLDEAVSNDESYSWIYENAHKYGFVLRYPEGTVDKTGITRETWHFRFVGLGAAYYMHENDLILEDFIALLYKYTYGGEHLSFTDDGGRNYEIYFCGMSAGDTSEIYVPTNYPYTVSGNNLDGFVVTVQK